MSGAAVATSPPHRTALATVIAARVGLRINGACVDRNEAPPNDSDVQDGHVLEAVGAAPRQAEDVATVYWCPTALLNKERIVLEFFHRPEKRYGALGAGGSRVDHRLNSKNRLVASDCACRAGKNLNLAALHIKVSKRQALSFPGSIEEKGVDSEDGKFNQYASLALLCCLVVLHIVNLSANPAQLAFGHAERHLLVVPSKPSV